MCIGSNILFAIRSHTPIRHAPLRRPPLSSLRRPDGAQSGRPRLHRAAPRRTRAHRRDACLADAAGRRRPGRGPVAGGAARIARGNQHPLGRAPRRDRGLAHLRHPARHRGTGLEGAIAASGRNGTRCASPATRARSTSIAPAATSRNSSPGAGSRWRTCPRSSSRSSARSTSAWCRNSRSSRRSELCE